MTTARSRVRNILDSAPSGVPTLGGLTNDELVRRRLAHAVDLSGLSGTDEARVAIARWALKTFILPAMRQGKLRDSLWEAAARIKSEEVWIRTMKAVSDAAKTFGNALDDDWPLLVNCELLVGYQRPRDQSHAIEEVRNWIERDVTHISDVVPSFDRLFRSSALEFFQFAKHRPTEVVTLDQYCADPGRWATAGSTSEYVEIAVGGRAVPKNKWSTVLGMHPLEVRALMEGHSLKQKAVIVQKREAGKVRFVIASDLRLYLRMAYASLWFDQYLKDHPCCSLLWSHRTTLSWRAQRHTDLSFGRYVFMPLDQSHFDWQVSRAMLLAVLDVLRELTEDAPDDVRRMTALACASIERGTRVLVGDVWVEHRKGILSGWRWTSFLGSIVNYATIRAVMRFHGLNGDVVVQGDDVATRFNDVTSAITLLESLSSLGFEVNPSKTFISRDRDEYLRQVYTGKTKFGYLARAIPSVMWRRPNTTEPGNLSTRAEEITRQWATLMSRDVARKPASFRRVARDGLFESMIESWRTILVRDVSQYMKIPAGVATSWLLTSKAIGGGGFGYNSSGYTMLNKFVESSSARVSLGGREVDLLPGLTFVVRQWDKLLNEGDAVTQLTGSGRGLPKNNSYHHAGTSRDYDDDGGLATRGRVITNAVAKSVWPGLYLSDGASWEPDLIKVRLASLPPTIGRLDVMMQGGFSSPQWRDVVPLTQRGAVVSVLRQLSTSDTAEVVGGLVTNRDFVLRMRDRLGKGKWLSWLSNPTLVGANGSPVVDPVWTNFWGDIAATRALEGSWKLTDDSLLAVSFQVEMCLREAIISNPYTAGF